MSLMEFLDVQDGALVPSYREALAPIRCDRGEALAEAVIDVGVSRPF